VNRPGLEEVSECEGRDLREACPMGECR